MVSSGGRLFIIVDEGPTASLALRPTGNWWRGRLYGVVLWKKPIVPWEGVLRAFRSGPVDLARRLVAVGDRVFVTLGYHQPVVALDAATGKLLRTYPETEGALEIVCDQGVLYVVAGTIDPNQYAQTLKLATASPPPHDKRLLAIPVESGEIIWRKADADAREILPTTLAVSGGQVYFHSPKELICLKDGKIASAPVPSIPVAPVGRRPRW